MNTFSQTNPRKDGVSSLVEILVIVAMIGVYSVLPGAFATEKPAIADTKMVWIPPGAFKLGSPSNEIGWIPLERPWTVTFTRGFFMAIRPSTR
ncbi:MAG: hypothetical protein FJ398_27570 [Verrucomicrobia bacterium]|nr:hypothetical protein [Verrucomicrobiota bacterium]